MAQTRAVCPVCGLSRVVSVFERTDEERFGTWDAETKIIEIRDAPGGKASDALVGTGKYRKTPGRGFPIIDTFTLDAAKDMPEYEDYIRQISEQLIKVVAIFRRQGLISDADIERMRGV